MQNKGNVRPNSTSVGIGLRTPHYKEILSKKPALQFLEVHPENYFGNGPQVKYLEEIAQIYPISFHGVGLSLGSSEGICNWHLQKLKDLVERFKPCKISEHASWSMSGNAHLNDLLPLPYNEESIQVLVNNIKKTQDFLGREILLENPSSYLSFKGDMPEYDFMNEVVKRTGCGLLLDINNIYVNSQNHNFVARNYIDNIDSNTVGEVHLAGHRISEIKGKEIRIDTHDDVVDSRVWDLYEYFISEKGVKSTLIEWDQNIPSLDDLVCEANKAHQIQKLWSEKNAA